MKKIPTLFLRDRTTGFVTPEIDPVNLWITQEVSTPHKKWDGTCVKYDGDGGWWTRQEVKKGQATPSSFILEDIDSNTEHMFGWIPYTKSSFMLMLEEAEKLPPYESDLYGMDLPYRAGTYELMGPKINNNPENLSDHRLIRHSASPIVANLTTLEPNQINYDSIREILMALPVEGVVWYANDGRRAKIKRRDFSRGVSKARS